MQSQSLSRSDSLTDFNVSATLSRSNSVISLPDEKDTDKPAVSTSSAKAPYSELHYLTTHLAGKGRSNTTYLQQRDQDGSLLPTLEQEPVRAQNLFHSAFSDRFSKPNIEDEENQSRLATIISIGKKYSKMLSQQDSLSSAYDSDDSDDERRIPRMRSFSATPGHKSVTKLELAPNLAQNFVVLQQQALLKKLQHQKAQQLEFLARKQVSYEQASKKIADEEQAAALDEQKTLEVIDAERKTYMAKWEAETTAAFNKKNDVLKAAQARKKESQDAAELDYNSKIRDMKESTGIMAGNLRYIKTKATGEISIPLNAHKKANYVTAEQYLKILDSVKIS